jgi:addiction module RelE/StbE family toxin
MKGFKIRFTLEAARLLSKLHPEGKRLVKTALEELRQNPYSGDDLQQELSGFKSYKTKRYRVLYDVNEEEGVIRIYYVGHRRDVYEQFRVLLSKLQKRTS